MVIFNQSKHQEIMSKILKDIYSDVFLAPPLGFKGGTCAYFFYNLPRFSVDLDFDLFDISEEIKTSVFAKVEDIMAHYGTIKDKYTKFYTVFFLLSYGRDDRNIKLEINIRSTAPQSAVYYQFRDYLGTPMLVAKPEYMFASKLIALTERLEMAPRDIYDINYFFKNNWNFDASVVEKRMGISLEEQINKCVKIIEEVKDNEIISGLGELVKEKEKLWIKKSLRSETIFLLKNYLAAMVRVAK